jgi:hypothetical protein
MSENASEARTPDQMPEGDTDRQHGQFLLDVMDARMRQGSEEHPALEVLRRAHQEQADKE